MPAVHMFRLVANGARIVVLALGAARMTAVHMFNRIANGARIVVLTLGAARMARSYVQPGSAAHGNPVPHAQVPPGCRISCPDFDPPISVPAKNLGRRYSCFWTPEQ
jgi:hypothetical protein